MSNELVTVTRQSVRGTDSNSLLRLYDQANEIITRSPSQQQRLKAGRAVEYIARELHRRNVHL